MDVSQAIKTLARKESLEAASVLVTAVRPLCKEKTIGLAEWLAGGEFDVNATPESIAAKWDELTRESNRAQLNYYMGWQQPFE